MQAITPATLTDQEAIKAAEALGVKVFFSMGGPYWAPAGVAISGNYNGAGWKSPRDGATLADAARHALATIAAQLEAATQQTAAIASKQGVDPARFAAGWTAQRVGTPWHSNPHPSGSVEAYSWDRGHTTARATPATSSPATAATGDALNAGQTSPTTAQGPSDIDAHRPHSPGAPTPKIETIEATTTVSHFVAVFNGPGRIEVRVDGGHVVAYAYGGSMLDLEQEPSAEFDSDLSDDA